MCTETNLHIRSALVKYYFYRKAVPSRRIEPTDTQLSPSYRDADRPILIPAGDVLTPTIISVTAW